MFSNVICFMPYKALVFICNSHHITFLMFTHNFFLFLLIDLTANITEHNDVLCNGTSLSNSRQLHLRFSLFKQNLTSYYLRKLSTRIINIVLLLQFAINLLQQTVKTSPNYILIFFFCTNVVSIVIETSSRTFQ